MIGGNYQGSLAYRLGPGGGAHVQALVVRLYAQQHEGDHAYDLWVGLITVIYHGHDGNQSPWKVESLRILRHTSVDIRVISRAQTSWRLSAPACVYRFSHLLR